MKRLLNTILFVILTSAVFAQIGITNLDTIEARKTETDTFFVKSILNFNNEIFKSTTQVDENDTTLVTKAFAVDSLGSVSTPWTETGDSVYVTGKNVGIGTSSPQYQLEVDDDAKVRRLTTIDDRTTGFAANIMQNNVGNTFTFGLGNSSYAVPSLAFINQGSVNPLVFAINSVEKMRIASDGKVGIGITPTFQFQLEADTIEYAALIHNDYTNGKGLHIMAGSPSSDNHVLKLETEAGIDVATFYSNGEIYMPYLPSSAAKSYVVGYDTSTDKLTYFPTPTGVGTVTSVGITGSDFTITNSPITSSGNIGLAIATGVVGATELESTTVTPASYTRANITVDSDGRITAASNGSGGGNVYKSGTPTLGQVAAWTNDSTIQGVSGLEVDNDTLITSYVKVDGVSFTSGNDAGIVRSIGGDLTFIDGNAGAKTLTELAASGSSLWTDLGTHIHPTNNEYISFYANAATIATPGNDTIGLYGNSLYGKLQTTDSNGTKSVVGQEYYQDEELSYTGSTTATFTSTFDTDLTQFEVGIVECNFFIEDLTAGNIKVGKLMIAYDYSSTRTNSSYNVVSAAAGYGASLSIGTGNAVQLNISSLTSTSTYRIKAIFKRIDL